MENFKSYLTSINIKSFSLTSESALIVKSSWFDQNSRESFLSSLNDLVLSTNRSINALSLDGYSLHLDFDDGTYVTLFLDSICLEKIRDAIFSSGCKFLLITNSKNKSKLISYNCSNYFQIKFSRRKKFVIKRIKRKRAQKTFIKKLSNFLSCIDPADDFDRRLGKMAYTNIFDLCELLDSQRRIDE